MAAPLNPMFLSNPDVISRRAHGRTVNIRQSNTISKSTIIRSSKNKMSNIDNKSEIEAKVKAGMNNLSYYKIDLAIEELEEALEMLQQQQ